MTGAWPCIAIIGGGFSGARIAANLACDRDMEGWRIAVFEPREKLGCGLAYDTDDPAHRVNVPAARMSLDPDDADHFLRWLDAHGEPRDDAGALASDGHLYPRRGLFGRYVEDSVAPFLSEGRIVHYRERVIGVERTGSAWEIRGDGGTELRADVLVVAATHPAPEAPAGIEDVLRGHVRYVPDTTVPGALTAIRPNDRVLIIGTGLTAADVIASLRTTGRTGPITAFSRRGLRSRGHACQAQDPYGDFTSPPAESATELLVRVRRAIASAEAEGFTWHAVFDALRAQGGQIWRNLPVAERRRLVQRLRPFWDVHRFRVAPQIDAIVSAGLQSGDIRILAGTITRIERNGDEIAVAFRRRRAGGTEHWNVDAVVVTTGPAHKSVLKSQSWLDALSTAGYLQADAVGLGLACSESSRALDHQGRETENLFIAGPLARGTFGELMGLPQVNDHAIFVAAQVAALARARKAAANARVPGAVHRGCRQAP
ncbi:FAD/NAD(P)-binding domain-containing protein [Sinorhizobium numidicum]|uniref:FAD/NAD(P)-binding domain-containing protein n=1 Tax=Sinorhizobium numidicum TaxID=680248 RepID=A0ABY8CM98_9HYPH|nr:FAD/NAD(P)-binding protein [Sinorhizobium numidicum]WEX73789.1 FAD/NAD(P)-binding domain-containing protein [Sinorhizobium numidicum]WEX79774.1 FAD/NAD(P)-binding domain-containing protein [Sinorhizobium numidicum]